METGFLLLSAKIQAVLLFTFNRFSSTKKVLRQVHDNQRRELRTAIMFRTDYDKLWISQTLDTFYLTVLCLA